MMRSDACWAHFSNLYSAIRIMESKGLKGLKRLKLRGGGSNGFFA
jgi:hypothetical protein